MSLKITSTFLNHICKLLDLRACHLEHVVNAIQHHLDHLSVLAVQQIAEWWDHTLLDQPCYLLPVPTDG